MNENDNIIIFKDITEDNCFQHLEEWLKSKYKSARMYTPENTEYRNIHFGKSCIAFDKIPYNNNIDIILWHEDYEEEAKRNKLDEPDITGFYIKNKAKYIVRSTIKNDFSNNAYDQAIEKAKVDTIIQIKKEMLQKAENLFIEDYLRNNEQKIKEKAKRTIQEKQSTQEQKEIVENTRWANEYLNDRNTLPLKEWYKAIDALNKNSTRRKIESNSYIKYSLANVLHYTETNTLPELTPKETDYKIWENLITNYFLIQELNKFEIPKNIRKTKEIKKTIETFVKQSNRDIKQVTVEFTGKNKNRTYQAKIHNIDIEGKTITTKVSTNRLTNITKEYEIYIDKIFGPKELVDTGYFKYNKELVNWLHTEEITKITYGKKIIWEEKSTTKSKN